MATDQLRFEDVCGFPLTKHAEFYQIALEGLRRAEALERLHNRRQRKKKLTDDDADYLARMNGLIELESMVAVVFSSLALEAFINDYAGERLTRSYFENYLDKLDLVSKWVVVPRLIHKKQLATGGRGMNLLRHLIALRNKLVHYKSKVKTISQLEWRKDWVNMEDAKESCNTVRTVVLELKQLDSEVAADWLAGQEIN